MALEDLLPASPKQTRQPPPSQTPDQLYGSDEEAAAQTGFDFLKTTNINFLSVKKINTSIIDFDSKYVVSTDGYNNLTSYYIDFLKLVAKSSNSRYVEAAIFDQEFIDLLCEVYPK